LQFVVLHSRLATMDLVLEWDEEKAKRNEVKHGVTFDETKTIL